jgi:hypothetical protein
MGRRRFAFIEVNGSFPRRFESEGAAPRKTRIFPNRKIAVWFGFQAENLNDISDRR